MSGMMGIRRQVKNVAYNFSEAQVKVREATSNDPWGPSGSLMNEIADLSHQPQAFVDMMQMLWKRLNDHGRNWRHVYKALCLLDHLIKNGSDRVAQQCRENIYTIETLKDFQYVEENKDQGLNVREKAKQIVILLKDEEKLRNERAKAQVARRRFVQNTNAFGSDGARGDSRRSDGIVDSWGGSPGSNRRRAHLQRRESELAQDIRPSSAGEEDLQLQIALALSREEAAQDEQSRRGDDVRLQMAVEESRRDYHRSVSLSNSAAAGESRHEPEAQSSHTAPRGSAIDDLLALDGAFAGGPPTASPPPPYQEGTNSNSHNSPWTDPWKLPPPVHASATASNDPWAPRSDSAPRLAYTQNGITADGATKRDPWNMESLGGNMEPEETMTAEAVCGAEEAFSDDTTTKQRKTIESFLGENSSLVNLNNLMGPSKTVVPGMPTKPLGNGGGTNPFGSSNPPPVANPFAEQRRPSPSLNQMRATHTTVTPDGQDVTEEWAGLEQPMQPSRDPQPTPPSSTNPFLS